MVLTCWVGIIELELQSTEGPRLPSALATLTTNSFTAVLAIDVKFQNL